MSHPTSNMFSHLHRVNVRTGKEDNNFNPGRSRDLLYIDNGAWFSIKRRCVSSADVEEDYGLEPEAVLILVFKFGQIKPRNEKYQGIYVDQPGVSPIDIDARREAWKNARVEMARW